MPSTLNGRGHTIADRRQLILCEEELCQIPDSNGIIVASGRIYVPVLKSARGRGEHGAFVGNPATNFFEP
jgi:hypothetical protein